MTRPLPENKRVVVVGSINTDMVVGVEKIPCPGETVLGGDLKMVPGGKGANQAVAAALLGAEVAMVGCVGADSFGTTGRYNLKAKGVDVSRVKVSHEAASGVAFIAVDDAGENAIMVAPGANMRLSREDIAAAAEILAGAAAVVMQLEIPLDVVRYTAEKAKAAGTLVVLNCAPAASLPDSLLAATDIVIVNESEAGALTGVRVEDHQSADQAARKIAALGTGCVVVTLGARGLVALGRPGEPGARDEAVWLKAFPVDAVDTTAAGDTFVGGLMARYLETGDFHDALMWGSAAAALAATRQGAQSSIPSGSEVTRFIGTRTWRELEWR